MAHPEGMTGIDIRPNTINGRPVLLVVDFGPAGTITSPQIKATLDRDAVVKLLAVAGHVTAPAEGAEGVIYPEDPDADPASYEHQNGPHADVPLRENRRDITPAILTPAEQDIVSHWTALNVPAQWFTGQRGEDGSVEVIALGGTPDKGFAWSIAIDADGETATTEAETGPWETGITA